MKKIMLLAAMLILAGCKPSSEVRTFPVLPTELLDCKFFYLLDGTNSGVTVARCPNSTTTVRQNDKAGTTTVVIDGAEYVKK